MNWNRITLTKEQVANGLHSSITRKLDEIKITMFGKFPKDAEILFKTNLYSTDGCHIFFLSPSAYVAVNTLFEGLPRTNCNRPLDSDIDSSFNLSF